jgi:hypothetical protein
LTPSEAQPVENDSIPHTFTATLNIPKYSPAETISLNLTATSNTSASDSKAFTISINGSKSLSISEVRDFSKIHNATIRVNNTGNTALTVALSALGDFNVTFEDDSFPLSAGSGQEIDVYTLADIEEMGLSSNEVTIFANATGASGATELGVEAGFCSEGNVNSSDIKITDIEDKSDNEWQWYPLDNVEIEVEVENKIGEDESFVVELALYDTDDNNFIELDGESSLTQDISIDDDDSDTVTFEFQVPADIEKSSGRYVLYIKAYVSGDEDKYCNSKSATKISSSADPIKIKKKTNDVVINDVTSSEIVTAGETVTITAELFNIGTENEGKVKVILTNTKLGLNLESSPSGIDMGESDDVDFSFVIPYTAENGAYTLKLVSYFDYSKSSGDYKMDSDPYEVKIKVVGGVANVTTTTTAKQAGLSDIAASLESAAKAGKEMEVAVTITNLGASQNTFIIGVSDYDSWATLGSISDRILALNKGESKEITVKFNVDKNATGEQTFTVESRAGDKVDSKEVAVQIEENSLLSRLKNAFGNNTLIWVIGLINLILIILIIYLAIRIFKR